MCVHVHIFYCQGYLQKVLPSRSYFSDLLAVFLLATVCAQLSHFGSSSRLWGQSPGIGGADQMTFRNADEVLPLIPSPSPPFPGFQLWNKEGKKNSNMMKTSSCRCRRRLGAGCLLHLSLCFATCYIPSPKAGIKQNISRILCYEWGRNVQFAPYLGMRRWNDRDKITLEHLKTGCGCLPSLFCFKQGCLFTVSAAPFL